MKSQQEKTINDLAQLKPDTLLEGKVFYNETESDYELLPFASSLEDSHTVVQTTDLRYWIDQSLGLPSLENSLTVGEGWASLFPCFDPKELSAHSKIFSNFTSSLGTAKPDVAYVFCSEILQILPNVKSVISLPFSLLFACFQFSSSSLNLFSLQHDGKPKLSLLVPSATWDGSKATKPSDHVIQIDCEVVATHILPLSKSKFRAGKNDTILED